MTKPPLIPIKNGMGVLSTGKGVWKFSQALSRFSHTLTPNPSPPTLHHHSINSISPLIITNNAFISPVFGYLASLIRVTILLHTITAKRRFCVFLLSIYNFHFLALCTDLHKAHISLPKSTFCL